MSEQGEEEEDDDKGEETKVLKGSFPMMGSLVYFRKKRDALVDEEVERLTKSLSSYTIKATSEHSNVEGQETTGTPGAPETPWGAETPGAAEIPGLAATQEPQDEYDLFSVGDPDDPLDEDSLFDTTTIIADRSSFGEDTLPDLSGPYDPFKEIDSKVERQRRESINWLDNSVLSSLTESSDQDAEHHLHHHHRHHHHHHPHNQNSDKHIRRHFSEGDNDQRNETEWLQEYRPIPKPEAAEEQSTTAANSIPHEHQRDEHQRNEHQRHEHQRRLTCAVIFTKPRIVDI
ncbi:hypothetical protein FOA43_001423 [Brettanomyces nanus]|uniref:Uncharacterized protein n=1 Tax=Eeniella nana TaxID=13502 RepID=A0A875S1Y9_EENNA|nr:uncharacterized protein FOA43_001423 [Brettanomyces nanus]QPG74102.1 hypothetical protein FOA43_001423 [Brettanomyces nanus]